MYISCDFGVVSVNQNNTKFGFVDKTQSLQQLVYRIDDSCTNYTMLMHEMQPCIGTNFCEMTFDRGWIKRDEACLKKINEENTGVMSVYCKDVKVSPWFKKNVSIMRSMRVYNLISGVIAIFYLYFLLGYLFIIILLSLLFLGFF